MLDRYRQLEGADQIALFGKPAAPGWFGRMLAALAMVLRSGRWR